MKMWNVIFAVVIVSFLLASCGKSGDATKIVPAPNPTGAQGGQTCQAYCTTLTHDACPGAWAISGVSPNCKCVWQCSEPGTKPSETATATEGTTKLWSKDKQVYFQVGENNPIMNGVAKYVPSTADTPGSEIIIGGPGLKDGKTVIILKKGIKDTTFKVANERPIDTVNGEQIATAPAWASDSGKTFSLRIEKLNGQVVSYEDDTQFRLTLVPNLN
jgi:hypothetical protein